MAKLKTNIRNLQVPFKNYLALSLFLALATLIATALLQKRLPPEIPLLYGAAEGEGQLVSSWGLTIPSVVSLLVGLLNFFLASFSKDEFTKKTLVLMALVVTFFSLVTTFKIFFLVGSF